MKMAGDRNKGGTLVEGGGERQGVKKGIQIERGWGYGV